LNAGKASYNFNLTGIYFSYKRTSFSTSEYHRGKDHKFYNLYTLSGEYLVNFVSLLEQVSAKLPGFDVMLLEKRSITDLQLGTGAVEFCIGHCSSILITQKPFYGTHLHVAI
jgi:hypothetical protein